MTRPYRRSLGGMLVSALLLAVALLGNVVAAPVAIDRAAQVAANWLYLRTGTIYEPLMPLGVQGAQGERQQRTYYIFNMSPDGWVIVAGDDEAYPVIGYAADGIIPASGRPPAFEAWMAGVNKEIAAAAAGSGGMSALGDGAAASTAARIRSAWERLERVDSTAYNSDAVVTVGDSVGPLLTTTWAQGQYYNAQCPIDSSGPDGRVFVGCVATAMGQIMRYHAHPETGTGSHSYSHPTYGTLSANFGATDYDWSGMPVSGSLSDYNDAVATLLSHAGIAVEMDYGPDSSGAYPQDVAPALRDYFGYSADDSVSRSGYTADAWMSKLRDDLDESRPVFYGGYGTGGHAFVCDGYLSSGDYFHFNWGWDGYADGYFLLNDLTPGGGDFNDGQAAVFGIEPEDDDGGILLDVLTQNYYAGNYDAYASYYGGLALAGYSAYRYYAYLYAYYVYLYGYQAYALSPSGSYTQTAAYSAFLYAYYRYLYAVYDYVYGGYGYYVLVYDLYGDLYRANVNLYATQGR